MLLEKAVFAYYLVYMGMAAYSFRSEYGDCSHKTVFILILFYLIVPTAFTVYILTDFETLHKSFIAQIISFRGILFAGRFFIVYF